MVWDRLWFSGTIPTRFSPMPILALFEAKRTLDRGTSFLYTAGSACETRGRSRDLAHCSSCRPRKQATNFTVFPAAPGRSRNRCADGAEGALAPGQHPERGSTGSGLPSSRETRKYADSRRMSANGCSRRACRTRCVCSHIHGRDIPHRRQFSLPPSCAGRSRASVERVLAEPTCRLTCLELEITDTSSRCMRILIIPQAAGPARAGHRNRLRRLRHRLGLAQPAQALFVDRA